MLEPLKNSAYRHLFSAQIIALLGTGLTTVALALLTYDLAGDKAGTVLGTALALKMIAYVTIAPIVGGLAAALPRKRVLVTLDLIRAGFVMCLPFVSEVWQIYLIIFLMQSCSAGFTPMFQATIPDIIPDEKGANVLVKDDAGNDRRLRREALPLRGAAHQQPHPRAAAGVVLDVVGTMVAPPVRGMDLLLKGPPSPGETVGA